MAMRGARGTPTGLPQAMSPESALASDIFDQFVSAGTFKAALSTYRQMCDVLQLSPSPLPVFYPRLKVKLRSWRAASLWAKLDKRAAHKCYNRGKACAGMRVLIIGGGPCGLRTAIEAQLLGAKVVVLEKRDRYSRNNVLHLWPFVIHDLRSLGAKKFFGKFCAGSIDHITSQYEFDVLIGADGKRNTLKGFNRREFRGKLAIAITANFMNRHTLEEARVQEISGVAFIFNQRFFQDMKETTGIDLENIVYYKDDTHYFVMTAKKQSLLERGVIINDYSDTARLLSPDNVDRSALKEYARDAADFATGYALPCLEFAVNHYGQPDVAMFDFTSMYAADNASRLLERHGHWLLQGLVGDSLLEPFWPTGSGCARGFLSSLDAAWMIRSWAANRDSPLHVLAERESIYRLLAQTTPENLSKDMAEYSLNPSSRYPNLNLQTVLPSQVRPLCRTDIEIKLPPPGPRLLSDMQRKRRRRESIIHPDALLSWCQRQVALYILSFADNSWLSAFRHERKRMLVIGVTATNLCFPLQAFDILEREYGIPPVMTGQEMADCAVPDKLTMVSYISQIYETFRREIPQGRPAYKVSKLIEENQPPPTSPLNLLAKLTSSQRPASKRKSSNDHEPVKDRSEGQRRSRVSITRSRRTRDRVADIVAGGDAATLEQYHKILSAMDKESFGKRMHALQEQLGKDYRPSSRGSRGRRSGHVSSATEDESSSVTGKIPRTAVEQLQEQLNSIGKPVPVKKREPKVGRIGKDEWNVKMLEERLRQQQKRQKEPKVEPEKPQILRDIFESKRNVMDARLKADGKETETDRARFTHIDERLQQLDRQLKEGSLDVGKRGANRVAAMADYIANVLDAQTGLREKRPPPPPPVVLYRSDSADGAKTPPLKKPPITQPAVPTAKSAPTSKQPAPTPTTTNEICCFCHKRVYLMERLSAEGLFFHRNCFRCEFCQCSLRLGNYAYDSTIAFKGKFYCTAHFRMERPSQRWQEMMKRKQAFLSANPEPPSLMPAKPASTEDTNSTLHRRRSPSPPHGGAGEGMEDPTKMEEVRSPPAGTDAGVVTFQPKTYKTPRQLSAEEMATLVDVDSTPERVEFENTLELLSEDELLTSELEEEELAQKNLGAVEVPTSDDEYSDYSDEEYSPPEVLSDDEHGRAASAQVCENGKDDVVSVPVPILNKDKGAGEQKSSTGSDDEYISDEEGITMSSSDVSSESEEEPPPPKHEIPVIIIDTPPGDQDTELDWGPKEVRAALGQVDDDASEPEADGIVDEAAHLGAGSVPEGMLGEEQTTPVSPRSSENQTSSDQLSIQKSGKLSRSAESLANASVSSGLSSSSNVDKFSEPVHAAGEAVPAIVENLESPSLTDVSDVSGATGTAPSSTTTSSKADRSPEEGKLGYNLLLDRAGSSGSSPLPTPEREVGAAFESDGDVSSESSAIRFGKLTGRESEASSSVASSSHYSVSSTGDGKSSGADDSSSEEHGPLVLKEHSPDVATPLEGMKECVSLGNKDISRTASGEPELSEGALLQVSTTALSDRPDSSETSTTDTCEEATVVHRQPLQADDGDVSPTGSLLDHVAAGIHVAQLLEGKGERAVDAMELVHPIASFNEESLGVLQFVPTKPGSPTGTDYVPTVEQEASNVSKGGIQKIADRTKLALDLNKDEPAAPKGETPDILSPRSDVTDEDTTCSASISDQEVFPTDADKLVTLEDPAVPSPVPQPVPRELMHAPIASMSDEDDLTASDLSRRGLQHGKSEPSVSKKTLLETMKEVQEAIGAAAAATPMGQQSDGDDFTVSEWAREGGDKESLSFVEDLKAEFSFDDKNVTRRRRRKRVSSGNKEDTEEAIEAVNIDHLKPSQEALDERLGGHLEPPQPSNTALTIITSGHDVKTSLQVDSTVAEVPGHHKGHSPLREPPRYQGYGGSFVEKVRSRSSEGTGAGSGEPQVPSGDVIYLRSLNINLQRLDFPSIRSSSPSSRGSCEELDSDCGLTAAGGTGPVVQSTQPPVARSAPVKIERPVKSADPRIRVRPNQFPESFPMSSTPLRPCADPVTAMLMSRREQLARKSVHEDIQNLPYFDSLSLAGDFDEFKTPPEANTPTETFGTPPTSRPCYLSALHAATDPERERARREARERARLKSDEELGLSPCSYRKKYARTPAFDEITLTDLLDQEDETFNALDDRSSLRSFSTAQHRLAQFEDDDEFGGGLDDNGNDSATPVASPARSTDDLDGIDDIVVGGITLMDPYQIRADVWKPKPPKPKRRLFARNEDDDRKTTPSPAASTTRRNLLSFLGFNRSSSGGDSSAATTKEKKESYNREKAAKDVAENERTKSFSRLRLSKTPRQEKSSSPKKVPAAKSDSAPCSTERVNASPELVAPKAAAVVSSVSRQHSHQPRPVVREEMKKHISLDNLKSQPMQLPAKSRSIEFGIMTAPRATGEEDGFADSDDRDLDGSAETGGPGDKKAKAIDPRKLERLTLRVQRQQERKRQRTAQELQRRLEEIEVSLRSLEHRGVLVERALRGEEDEDEDLQAEEKDLTQVLFRLMRQKNKLSREEQELLIRVKDLELEDQQSKLQQEMRERMAIDDAEKSPRDIEKEREILNEMLEIVEKRDRLVAQMDQLRIREETEEKELAARILTQGAT
ncbi:hypothetical protein HPB49_018343 [Dermacentor silvarum]|uniref:Uncharacterized protein n=1 Tax=Dermacentor silvarum TaxID=543639 RepID=A0ACB8C4U6_DERSI|nr:hypothetical protein HPB49_018343 [Dermacentor silvarum]